MPRRPSDRSATGGARNVGKTAAMSSPVRPRPLGRDEIAVLRAIVDALGPPAAGVLADQIRHASVAGGIPTMLDLTVSPGVDAAAFDDGPLPIRALVADDAGEIIVWIERGRLAALE